jgi:hypothetical protein
VNIALALAIACRPLPPLITFLYDVGLFYLELLGLLMQNASASSPYQSMLENS